MHINKKQFIEVNPIWETLIKSNYEKMVPERRYHFYMARKDQKFDFFVLFTYILLYCKQRFGIMLLGILNKLGGAKLLTKGGDNMYKKDLLIIVLFIIIFLLLLLLLKVVI